jgi:Holliday junction resolvase
VFNIAAEKTFENKIKKFLDDRGAYFIKYWAGAQYTKSGIPDILACINGYFVGVEVKAQNGKPSEIQLFNIKKINNAGGFAFVLYPSAFDRFKTFVKNLEHDRYNRDEIPEIWK